MPTLDVELTRVERLMPIGRPETGELVLVDKGWLKAVTDGFAEAIGAVTRLNQRMGGILQERRCTKSIIEAGKSPPDCPTPADTGR